MEATTTNTTATHPFDIDFTDAPEENGSYATFFGIPLERKNEIEKSYSAAIKALEEPDVIERYTPLQRYCAALKKVIRSTCNNTAEVAFASYSIGFLGGGHHWTLENPLAAMLGDAMSRTEKVKEARGSDAE